MKKWSVVCALVLTFASLLVLLDILLEPASLTNPALVYESPKDYAHNKSTPTLLASRRQGELLLLVSNNTIMESNSDSSSRNNNETFQNFTSADTVTAKLLSKGANSSSWTFVLPRVERGNQTINGGALLLVGGNVQEDRTAYSTNPVSVEHGNRSDGSSEMPVIPSPSHEWLRSCIDRKKKTGLKPFQVPWGEYRLGDCIKLCWKDVCAKGPNNDTMAAQYGNRACKTGNNHVKGGNLTEVENLFQRRKADPRFVVPAVDELVIHLRLGDVVEKSKASIQEMLISGADPVSQAFFFMTSLPIWDDDGSSFIVLSGKEQQQQQQ
jgi:hypothetical protein